MAIEPQIDKAKELKGKLVTFNDPTGAGAGVAVNPEKADFIISRTGIQALKPLAFNLAGLAGGLDTDRAVGTSMLNTPVFSNLVFPAGSYEDLAGGVIFYQGLRIDTVLFTVSQQKNIITTAIQGRNGTVKEYISDGDFIITATGVIVNADANAYPEFDVAALVEVLRVPDAVKVTSEFLDHFDITDVVVESYDLPQERGTRNSQLFTIAMLSDTPLELQQATFS